MLLNSTSLITKCLCFLLFGISAYGQTSTISDLKTNGASGFPQGKATVLLDDENLKVSIVNDSKFLAVQAIIWTDNDDEKFG